MYEAYKLHNISKQDLKKEDTFEIHAKEISSILRRADVIIAHKADWDFNSINAELWSACCNKVGMQKVECTVTLAEECNFTRAQTNLHRLCQHFGIDVDDD